MRLLVTGASGLLGLNLALEASKQHEVYGVINQHLLNTTAFHVEQVDLLSPGAIEQILELTQPEWVIHCAALANVDACESEPALAKQLNTTLPVELAKHVAKGGARLVHISTDAVFDGSRGEYSELDVPNPLSIYARTKLEGERAVLAVYPQAIVARVNLFGWSLRGQRSLGEWFFNNLQAGKQMRGFTDVYFCPLLANHLAALLLIMLEKQLSGLYHVVSSECISKYAFGVEIARRFGFDESLIVASSVTQAGLAAARSPKLTLQTSKLSFALGEPPPTLPEGIEGFFTLYRNGYPAMIREMDAAGQSSKGE
jgi:dTDP-4-dehydrorhamnose reductase